jgi:hypothetical protein
MIQNENPFGPLAHDCETFKLMNLKLERVTCESLMQDALEKRYSKYLRDFSRKEFEQEFLLTDERIDEVFGLFTSFIERCLVHGP